MAQKPTNTNPVTGVCIVSDPQKCPPSYELLMRSKDRESDCDLWRETNMFKKTTRYLCFTRAYNKNNQDQKVLASIQILPEKELPPPGFMILEKTIDSEERALKKKQFCVKFGDRNSLTEAISDIIIHSKVKRAPEGYTLIGGDVNSLMICVKVSRIPPETQTFNHTGSSQTNGMRPAPAPPIAGYPLHPMPAPRLNQSLNVFDKNEMSPINALTGIEFQINPSIHDTSKKTSGPTPSISYRSLNDIENEYHYSFALEQSFLQKTAA